MGNCPGRFSRAQRAVVSGHLATVLRASERSPHRSQFSSHDGTKSWFFFAFRAARDACETHRRVLRRFANVNPWCGDTASTGTGQAPGGFEAVSVSVTLGRCQVRFRG